MGDTGQGTSNGRNGGGASRPSATPIAVKVAPNGDVAIGDVANFGKGAEQINDNNIDALRRRLGQTGLEAGNLGPQYQRTYIGIGRAYNINQYLRTDHKDIKSDQSGWNGIITKAEIRRDIKSMDKGMKPLQNETQLFRFDRGEMFGAMMESIGIKTGITRHNIDGLINNLKNNPTALQDLSNALKGQSYVNKAYNSFSYNGTHPGFGDYAVQFRVVAKPGTSVIATINKKEFEVLGGHHLKYVPTGGIQIQRKRGFKTDWKTKVRSPFDRDQLIIDVYVENTAQTNKL